MNKKIVICFLSLCVAILNCQATSSFTAQGKTFKTECNLRSAKHIALEFETIIINGGLLFASNLVTINYVNEFKNTGLIISGREVYINGQLWDPNTNLGSGKILMNVSQSIEDALMVKQFKLVEKHIPKEYTCTKNKKQKVPASLRKDLLNSQNSEGKTMLMNLAAANVKESVQWLLKQDAEINTQDNDGNTALHAAIIGNAHEAFKILLNDSRIDLNLRNNNGQSVEDLASAHTDNFYRTQLEPKLKKANEDQVDL